MKAELGDQEVIAFHRIDESMLRGDPSRPESGELVAQRLGLAEAFERAADGVLDQQVD